VTQIRVHPRDASIGVYFIHKLHACVVYRYTLVLTCFDAFFPKIAQFRTLLRHFCGNCANGHYSILCASMQLHTTSSALRPALLRTNYAQRMLAHVYGECYTCVVLALYKQTQRKRTRDASRSPFPQYPHKSRNMRVAERGSGERDARTQVHSRSALRTTTHPRLRSAQRGAEAL